MNIRIALEKIKSVQRLAMSAAFLSGALMVLAFAPFNIHVLPVLLLAFLLWMTEGATPRRAAWRGFAFGAGLFGLGMQWLYISLHVYGKAPGVLALVLMLGLVAIMAAYYAAFAWLLNRFWPVADGVVAWRRNLLAAPALWVLLEWIRSWFLSGLPWFSLGYSQTDTWLAGYAPVGGVFLVSLVLLVLAGSVRQAFTNSAITRFVSAVVVLVAVLGGYILNDVQWTKPTGETVKVALVQGNIPQDQKWLPGNRQSTIETYVALTREVIDDADLIVWPEAAIPLLYSQLDDTLFTDIENEMLGSGQRLVTGVLVHEVPRDVYYNSAVVLGGEERRFYHKRHLVPFGEYFPVPDTVRNWLRLMNLPYSDFQPGEGDNTLRVDDNVTAAMLICYEAVFGNEALDAMPASGMIINISNDGWFGKSIGPKQHFQITRMRAMEAGRWLVRATNTGITAFVDPNGKVVSRLPAFETKAETRELELMQGSTPVVRWGSWLLLVFIMVFLAASLVRRSFLKAQSV